MADYKPITMPVETIRDIGKRFKSVLGEGKYVLKLQEWYGLHRGQKVPFKTIKTTFAQLDDGGDLIEVTRLERITEWAWIPNGKSQEIETTYQRVAIPGLSENANDLVPETMTKNVTKKFFYDQVNKADKYRYVLAEIVTQIDILCVTSGKDSAGKPRDPYPVALQQHGLSYRVEDGTETEFIEAFKVNTQSFRGDEITNINHEFGSLTADIETSSMNAPPVEVDISEQCQPPYRQVRVATGAARGKTMTVINPNVIHTDEAEQMAEEILAVNSWIKQITRVKTYLGIIPIHIINKGAGNVGYTISVNHQAPSAVTTITHVEMEKDDE